MWRAMLPRFLITFLLIALGSVATAQEVRLVSKSSGLVIGGSLLSFDGDHYRLDTIYGPLTVNAAGVICKGADCPGPGSYSPVIRISGDRKLVADLLPALINGFAKDTGHEITRSQPSPDRISVSLGGATGRFDLHATTTAEGYVDLISEVADIALVTRPPNMTELGMSRSGGSRDLLAGDRAHILAVDALVFTKPDGQRAEALSLGDLNEGSEGLAASAVDAPFALEEALAIALPGARPQGGVALSLLSAANPSDILPLTDGCRRLDPTNRLGDYPFPVHVMLYTAPRRLPKLGRDFLKFLDSPKAAQIIAQAGFSPLSLSETEFTDLGQRLAAAISRLDTLAQLEDLKRYTSAVEGKRRLTGALRFITGTTKLDMPSRDRVRRLAKALNAGGYDGRKLTLAGFSDSSTGSFETSRRFARTVRKALGAHDKVEIAVAPFGNVMQVSCDDTALGARLNRRVEIWVE